MKILTPVADKSVIRELRHFNLIASLNAHQWVHVACIYNVAGYAHIQYDTRLADAVSRAGWSPPPAPKSG